MSSTTVKRNLTAGEIALAKQIFGDSISYNFVTVQNRLHPIVGLNPKVPATAPDGHIWFRPDIYQTDFSASTVSIADQAIFLHEMTHVWQDQHGRDVAAYGSFQTTYDYSLSATGDFFDLQLEQKAAFVEDLYRVSNGLSPRFNKDYKSGDPLAPLEAKYKQLLPVEKTLRETDFTERENNYRCFGSGTTVEMENNVWKPIETVAVGDYVLAFDPSCSSGRNELKKSLVTQVQTREVEETLDFHGTIVTPGHVFLSGDGTFKKLADILEEDGTVVREDGTVIRARTNCPVGSENDRAVPLRYTDPETGKVETASIRAGAPFAADGDKVVTVAEAMRKIGYELGTDGLFVDLDGNKVPAQWPWGRPEPTNLAENRVSFV